MDLYIILIILFLVFSDSARNCYSYFTATYVKSSIDGNEYSVVADYEDQQKAADLMAEINFFTTSVLDALVNKYLTISPVTPEQIKGFEVASILKKKYTRESLSENKPTSARDTSYTQNKGEIISLCLREKQTGTNKFHSIDVIKFVMLHELAHIITPEIDHSDQFWTNFRFLLEFCHKYNLYAAPNYNLYNEVYCGMTIRYNPVHDNVRTVTYFTDT